MKFNHYHILIILMIFIASISIIPASNGVDVFITSDRISGNATLDRENLYFIKDTVENGPLQGKVNVTVDPLAPKPGETYRAITGTKSNGVAVYLASACAGSMVSAAKMTYQAPKGVIYVNTGQLNLKNVYILRRSFDDNFSSEYFASIINPYKFLTDAGVRIIQPNVDCSGSTMEEKNQFIAREINRILINDLNLTSTKNRVYRSSQVIYHQLSPSVLAEISKGICTSRNNNQTLKTSYNGYSLPRYLLMASEYIVGYSLKKPAYVVYAPGNSKVASTYIGNITYSEYREISTRVSNFIRKNHRAPSYVTFKEKLIGYRDLIYMYACLTINHTSKAGMTLPRIYTFTTYLNSTPAS